jgi:hypothetical protein
MYEKITFGRDARSVRRPACCPSDIGRTTPLVGTGTEKRRMTHNQNLLAKIVVSEQ